MVGVGIWLWEILLFNGIVREGFINEVESGFGLWKKRWVGFE